MDTNSTEFEDLENFVLARRTLMDLIVYAGFYSDTIIKAIDSLEEADDAEDTKKLYEAIRTFSKERKEYFNPLEKSTQ